jgi:hypothetical protein
MGSVLIKAGDSKLKRASEFSICAYAGSRMDVNRQAGPNCQPGPGVLSDAVDNSALIPRGPSPGLLMIMMINTMAAALAVALLTPASASPFAPSAPRYWPKFGGSRAVQLLDGQWDYNFIDGWDSGFDSMNPSFKPSDATLAKTATVPSCSDVVAGGAAGYLGPRGVAMYKTSFDSTAAPSGGGALPVRLQFQSCSFYCRIFVNGQASPLDATLLSWAPCHKLFARHRRCNHRFPAALRAQATERGGM